MNRKDSFQFIMSYVLDLQSWAARYDR